MARHGRSERAKWCDLKFALCLLCPQSLNTAIRNNLFFFSRPGTPAMPCSTEGALMRRHVGGAGCGARVLSRKQAPGHLGSPSAPLRELPSVAGTGQERGRRKPPGKRESRALRSGPRSTVPRLRDATCGAPEGGRADRKARGTFAGCPCFDAPFGAPPPLWGRQKKTGARAPQITPERESMPAVGLSLWDPAMRSPGG